MRWVQSLPVKSAPYTRVSSGVTVVLLIRQLPAAVPGKAAEDSPHTWAPATQVEDQEGVPSSQLQLDPVLNVANEHSVLA